ncbi:hypothetical protein DMENIID0001_067780 [Sergentomyia squamirostris]
MSETEMVEFVSDHEVEQEVQVVPEDGLGGEMVDAAAGRRRKMGRKPKTSPRKAKSTTRKRSRSRRSTRKTAPAKTNETGGGIAKAAGRKSRRKSSKSPRSTRKMTEAKK